MEKTTLIVVVAAALLLFATTVKTEDKIPEKANESDKSKESLKAEASNIQEKDPLETQATTARRAKENLQTQETRDPPHPAPEPYQFSFETKDPKAGEQFRKEDGSKDGVVKGSYGFRTPNGVFRIVDYIADSLGFRAKIRSNEPGISNRQPTAVKVEASRDDYIEAEKVPPPPLPRPVVDDGVKVGLAVKDFGHRLPPPPPPPPPPAPIQQVTHFNKGPILPPLSKDIAIGGDYGRPYDPVEEFKKPVVFDSEKLPPPPPPPIPSKVIFDEKAIGKDVDVPPSPVKSLLHYKVWFNKYAPPNIGSADQQKYSPPPPPPPPSDDYFDGHAAVKVPPLSGGYEADPKFVPPPPPPPPSTLLVKDYSPLPPPPKAEVDEKSIIKNINVPVPPVKSLLHYKVWFNKYAPPPVGYIDHEKYKPSLPPSSDDYVEEHSAIKTPPLSGDYETHQKFIPPPPPPPPSSQNYDDEGIVIKKPPFASIKHYDYDQKEDLPPPPPPPTAHKEYLGGVSYVKESLPPKDYDDELPYTKIIASSPPRFHGKEIYGQRPDFYKGPRITVIYHDLYNNLMGFRPYKYPVHSDRDNEFYVLDKTKKYIPYQSPPKSYEILPPKHYETGFSYDKRPHPPPVSKDYIGGVSYVKESLPSPPKDYNEGFSYIKDPLPSPPKDYDEGFSYIKDPLPPPSKHYDGEFAYDKKPLLLPSKGFDEESLYDKEPLPSPKYYADEHSFIKEPLSRPRFHGRKPFDKGYNFYRGPRITVIYHDLYNNIMGLRPYKYPLYTSRDPEFFSSKTKHYAPLPPPPPPIEKSRFIPPEKDFGHSLPDSKLVNLGIQGSYKDRPRGFGHYTDYEDKPDFRGYYPIRYGGPRVITFSKCRNGGCGPFGGVPYNGCKGDCGKGVVSSGVKSIHLGGQPAVVVVRRPPIERPPVSLKVIAITAKAIQPEAPTVVVSKPVPKVTKVSPLLLAIKPAGSKCALVCGK